ncbi:MAG: hypothetical protein ACM3NH_03810 [Candidatus Saccharibacteria bacterium]
MTREESVQKKQEYARAVCVFLADGLRSKRIPLQHAAEIAEKVVENINLIDSEEDFLKFIKNLSKDFEEMVRLEDRVYLNMKIDKRKTLEAKVRGFVVMLLQSDLRQSVEILDEAVKGEADIDALGTKFPKFRQYLENQPND